MKQGLTGGTGLSTDAWGRDLRAGGRAGQGSDGENTCTTRKREEATVAEGGGQDRGK